MSDFDGIDSSAEMLKAKESSQISLATLRWLLMGLLSAAAWAGAATMAVSAAHEVMNLHTAWAWIAGAAATLPVALGVMRSLDRLIEAPSSSRR